MLFVYNFIYIISEMAPYLLFGFLVAGVLSQIIPTSWVQQHLAGRGYSPIIKSAMIGIPLPLCSCGVIPVMASLRKQGANIPAMLSFILSTPQTGVDSILATYALLGLPMAIYRPFIALITALLGGSIYYWTSKKEIEQETEKLEMEKETIRKDTYIKYKANIIHILSESIHYGFITLPHEISRTLLFGIFIAGIITTFIPPGIITNFLNIGVLQIFIAILVGIPIYVCATASIPVALSLIYLGASPGSALAFLIAGPATNIATISVVKQFLGNKAVVIYILTMVFSALFFGITFDYLVDLFPFFNISHIQHIQHSSEIFHHPLKISSLILFVLILILSLLNIDPWVYIKKATKENSQTNGYIKVKINGMTCNHCVQRISTLIKNISNVVDINISLEDKTAIIYGNPSLEEVNRVL
ncbi:MAG: SO_0444 family Cu/Zn efflux transporter, partial [Candidatus Hydrogenedens sp.]